MPLELLNRRTERSKTFNLGNRLGIDIYTRAIHYKDDYSNPSEPWKDIDTNFVDGKVLKAPYELIPDLDNRAIHIRDKKTGAECNLRLANLKTDKGEIVVARSRIPIIRGNQIIWEDLYEDTDLIIYASNGQVFLRRVLKSAKSPIEAEFEIEKIKGDIPIRAMASCPENYVPLEIEQTSNGFIERPDIKGRKFPIVVDPSVNLQVDADTDNCIVRLNYGSWDFAGTTWFCIANANANDYKRGGGFRFLSTGIPHYATITTAYMTFTCRWSKSGTVCNTRFTGELGDTETFSDLGNYQGRRGTVVGGADDDAITDAQVDWDGLAAWLAGVEYQGPEIKTIVSEIVNADDWETTYAMTIFWDDHDGRSDSATERCAYAHSEDNSKATKLHVEYAFEESCSDGFKGGDSPATQCSFQCAAADGLKQGDSPSTLASLQNLLSDGLKGGDSPLARVANIQSFTKQVGQSTDDAHVYAASIIDLTNANHMIGYSYYNGYFHNGQRFTGIDIPDGATIKFAKLIFRARISDSYTPFNTRIQGEQNNAAATFSTYPNFVGRTKTTAYVDWAVEAWTAGNDYESPDISPIIQELVDDYGGLSNASIVLFWSKVGSTSPDSFRRASSYNDSPSTAPQLYVEWYLEGNLYPTLTDGLKAGDSTMINRILEASLADGTKLSDSPLAGLVRDLLLSDGFKVSDVSSIIKSFDLSLTDGLKLSDTLSTLLQFNPALADGLKLSEALSAIKKTYPTLIDGVKLGDLTTYIPIWDLEVTDGIKVGDVVTANIIYQLQLTDGIKLSDTISYLVYVLASMLLATMSISSMDIDLLELVQMDIDILDSADMDIDLEAGGD